MPCRGVGITPVLLPPVFLGETTRAVHVEQGVDRLKRLLGCVSTHRPGAGAVGKAAVRMSATYPPILIGVKMRKKPASVRARTTSSAVRLAGPGMLTEHRLQRHCPCDEFRATDDSCARCHHIPAFAAALFDHSPRRNLDA